MDIFFRWRRRHQGAPKGPPTTHAGPAKVVDRFSLSLFPPCFSLLFLSLLAVFILTSCRGDSDGAGVVVPPGSGSPGQTHETSTNVSAAGEIDFVGSGDFSGVVIAAQGLEAAAGGSLKIVMDPAPTKQNGYIPVGNLYTLTLHDSAGNEVSAQGMVTLSIPYKKNVVANAGVGDELVLLRNGQTVTAAVSPEQGVLTATLAGFSDFVVAYHEIPPTAKPHPLPLIEVGWDGYDVAEKIIDPSPSNRPIADPLRGLQVVQMGEKVQLWGRATDVSRAPYTSYTWDMVSRPAGSSAQLSGSGGVVDFIPDQVGRYEIKLTAGNAGTTDSDTIIITAGSYSYLVQDGKPDNYCGYCHAGGMDSVGYLRDIYGRQTLRDLVGPWSGSTHARAYDNLTAAQRNDTVCLNCHTTGFHRGDNERGTPSARGFDDFITDWSNPSASADQSPHLQGVSCEACHGPGGAGGTPPESSGFQHDYQASLSQGPCMACHKIAPDEQIDGRDYYFAWEGDLHREAHRVMDGQVRVVDTYPCYHCHVGQYFIGRMHGKELTPAVIDQPKGVTCVVCHDPHGETGYKAQLRTVGRISIPLQEGGTRSVDAGPAAVCYSCHNAYYTMPAVGEDLHGNQAEMLEGFGGWEYGQEMPVGVHGMIMTDKCVGCHMVAEQDGDKVITHQRRLYEGDDIATASDYTLAGCKSCHQGSLALPTTGNRFDYKGRFSEIKTTLEELQARINELTGREDPQSPILPNYEQTLSGDKLTAINRAAYNYLFVKRDGSYGIHNYAYAAELLRLSLADLEGY